MIVATRLSSPKSWQIIARKEWKMTPGPVGNGGKGSYPELAREWKPRLKRIGPICQKNVEPRSHRSLRGLSDFVLLRGRICAELEGCSARSRGGFRLRADLKQKNAVLGGLGFS
jgi:hypothetical protein